MSTGSHLLIIPDGHRRYAERMSVPLVEVYSRSAALLCEITEWCANDERVRELSIGCLWEYNLDREPEELLILGSVARNFFRDIAATACNYDVRTVGEREGLEKLGLQSSDLPNVEDGKETQVNLLFLYNGAKETRRAVIPVDSSAWIGDYTQNFPIPPVDIVVRNGQEKGVLRLSQYFPGVEQARLFAVETPALDFSVADLDKILSQ